MTPLDKLHTRIKELRELGERACPGPWHINSVYDGVAKAVVTSQSHPLCKLSEPFHRQCHHGTGQDAEFIAASRTALPAALAALEECLVALGFYAKGSHQYAEDGAGIREDVHRLPTVVNVTGCVAVGKSIIAEGANVNLKSGRIARTILARAAELLTKEKADGN